MELHETLTLGLAAVAGIIGIGSFIKSHYRSKEEAELRADVNVLQKQMTLFWSIVEKEIGNMLHSPHREELDRLIERNARRETLTPEELERFAALLQEITEEEDATPGEQAAAVILKAALLARHAHGYR